MGTLPGNKILYDRCSLDSLSFADLLSNQDLQPNSSSNSNPNYSKPISNNKQSPEFEFVSTKTNSNVKPNTVKSTPADLLISNGQLQPQALLIQDNQALITNPPHSMGSLLAIDRSSSRKRSSNEQIDSIRKKYEERFHKETNKKSTMTTASRGRKLLKCFVSPCRECRATKPEAVKEHTGTRQKGKVD